LLNSAISSSERDSCAKSFAGEPEHDEPVGAARLVQRLEPLELRREAALRRGVDDEHDLAAVLGQLVALPFSRV